MSWTMIIGVGGGLVLLAVVIYGFRQGFKVRRISTDSESNEQSGMTGLTG